MDENLIDRLHRPLTKTIPHYLNKLRSIDQSINDMQHITESCMVFNAPFNNISALLWQSVLLVEETGGPRENH